MGIRLRAAEAFGREECRGERQSVAGSYTSTANSASGEFTTKDREEEEQRKKKEKKDGRKKKERGIEQEGRRKVERRDAKGAESSEGCSERLR